MALKAGKELWTCLEIIHTSGLFCSTFEITHTIPRGADVRTNNADIHLEHTIAILGLFDNYSP